MIQGLLMLSGIVFPILYFFQKKELNKLRKDFLNIKYEYEKIKNNQEKFREEVLKEAKKYTTPNITADFPLPKFKEEPKTTLNKNSNPNFNPIEIEYYRDKKIKKEFLYPKKGLEDNGNYFFGKKVVITGDFKEIPDRNQMAKMLWEVGADIDTTVGKNTDILIVGDNAGDVKIEYAEQNNIEIMYEENFLEEF